MSELKDICVSLETAKTLNKKWGKTKVFPCEYITSDIVPEWALRYKVAKKLPISTAFAGAVRIF